MIKYKLTLIPLAKEIIYNPLQNLWHFISIYLICNILDQGQ